MKTLFQPIALIALFTISLLGSGCFDVLEEIFIRADGSGFVKSSWSYGDLANFVEEIEKSIGDAKEEEEETGKPTYEGLPDPKLDESFEALVDRTREIPGISEVIDLSDKDNHILSYSFSFDNIDALNLAMARNGNSFTQISGAGGDAEENDQPRFAFDGKKLTTIANMKLDEETLGDKSVRDMTMSFYKGHSYIIQYTFEQDVKKVKKNKAALKGANDKTVIVEVPLEELLTGTAKLDNQILLKK